MNKTSSYSSILSLLLTAWILQVSSLGHAQTLSSEAACSQAQSNFVSAMEMFRSAYFQRRDTTGSAESVMANQVLPSAEKVYQSCPVELVVAIENVVNRSNASLFDPRRGQLVDCDRALIAYQRMLRKYDTQNLPSYQDYRNLLYRDIDPAADAAVAACREMPNLARQTRVEILERQRRLDSMEDIDNQGPSYWDTRHQMEEYNEAYEAAVGGGDD